MRISNALCVMAAAAALAVTMAAAPTMAAAQSMVEEVVRRGTLRVGMSTFVPWAMRDKDGDLIGFEVDVAKKVAADMGVEIELVPTAWSGIIPALLAGKFDIIIGGLSITPQRNLTINFTRPYAQSGQEMVVNRELAKDFTSLDQYNSTDVTFACRRGTPSCDLVQEKFPKATLRQFDDEAQAFQEVINGNAHAMIGSTPTPAFWAEQYPEKARMANNGETLTHSNEAFGLRKGDVDSLNFFSNWILVNTANGWLQKTHDYWFKGKKAWEGMVAPQ